MLEFLLSDEERAIRDEVRAYVRAVPSDLLKRMDRGEVDYPFEFTHGAAARGLLGLRFPREQGGRGATWVAECAALEEIGVLGSGLGCAYAMPSIVGEALNRFGTPEQKARYLAPTLAGKLVAAEALTEPRGGSDFFGATTRAVRRGDRWVLEGQKRFIVGGQGADYFLVYACTDPEKPPRQRIATFIVERSFGVETEALYELMGLRGMGTARLKLRGVEVPAENVLGGPERGAEIFDRMMVPERLTSAAGALGIAAAALRIAARYSDLRHAFGQKIRKFEGVSFKIAEGLSALDAARGLVFAAARAADAGLDARRLVSEAKLVATECAWRAADDAMQILGGIGYTDIYPIERLLRDARLGRIWTGSNEVMKLLIQHEYYRDVLAGPGEGRDVEADAAGADKPGEKIYT